MTGRAPPRVDQPAASMLQDRVAAKIGREIRPLLRVHGGDCELVGVDGGVVRIRFLMTCTACKLRPLTLLAAIRPRLLEIDGVTDVRAAGVGVSDAAIERTDRVLGRHDRDSPSPPRSPQHDQAQEAGHADQ